MLKVIDVSGWQGDNIDWLRVYDSGVRAVFLKSSGTEPDRFGNPQCYRDRTYEINRDQLRTIADIRMGAYHYCSFEFAPAIQAKWFYDMAQLRDGIDLPPALDLEQRTDRPKGYVRDYVRTLVDYTRTQFGCLPILYTGWWGWVYKYMLDFGEAIPDWFKECPLWIANYPLDPPPPFEQVASDLYKPYMPPQYPTDWMFWQYTDKGRVPGISAGAALDVDLDVFRGDDDALKLLIDYCWSAEKRDLLPVPTIEGVTMTTPSRERYEKLKDEQLERASVNEARAELMGIMAINGDKRSFYVGESINYSIALANFTRANKTFGVVGLEVMDSITGEKTFETLGNYVTVEGDKGYKQSGAISINTEGEYLVSLHVCHSSVEEAVAGRGKWEKLTDYIRISTYRFRSKGIVCEEFEIETPDVKAGEQIWFKFKVRNETKEDVRYSILSVRTEFGSSGQSWTNQTLKAGQVLEWRDNIRLWVAADHPVFMGMWYGSIDDGLRIDAVWERLTPSKIVRVR